MGKSRGGKYKHKPRKGPGAADDDSEEEEYSPQKRGLGTLFTHVICFVPLNVFQCGPHYVAHGHL